MFGRLKTWLSGSSGPTHPLDRDKDEHLAKKHEAQRELEDLRERRDSLKEKLAEKKRKYKEAESAGEEARAKDILRDSEEIKKKLKTVRGRIDEKSKQRNLASNMANLKEVGESLGGEYWDQLREMDREVLIRQFQQQEMEAEQLHKRLRETSQISDDSLSSFQEGAEQLHADSTLEDEWSEETTGVEAEEVFEDIDLDDTEETTESATTDETVEFS